MGRGETLPLLSGGLFTQKAWLFKYHILVGWLSVGLNGRHLVGWIMYREEGWGEVGKGERREEYEGRMTRLTRC
jgi:hypothetical protein